MIALEKATEADYPVYAALFAEIGMDRPLLDRDSWCKSLMPSTLTVVDADGRRVGFMTGRAKARTEYYLQFLAIEAQCRRRGIGTEAIRLLKTLLAPSYLRLTLDCDVTHEWQMRWCTGRLGMRLTGHLFHYRAFSKAAPSGGNLFPIVESSAMVESSAIVESPRMVVSRDIGEDAKLLARGLELSEYLGAPAGSTPLSLSTTDGRLAGIAMYRELFTTVRSCVLVRYDLAKAYWEALLAFVSSEFSADFEICIRAADEASPLVVGIASIPSVVLCEHFCTLSTDLQ